MRKLTERCKHNFDTGDRNRGRSYFYDELVQIETVGNGFLYASATGSYQQDYDITLNWSETAKNRELAIYCSCPRFAEGWPCKHLWAILLEMDAREVAHQVPGRGKLSIGYYENASLATAKPKAGTSTATRKKQKPAWKKTFELLEQTTQDGAWNEHVLGNALETKKREAWYVLSIGQSLANQTLILEFFELQTKKNGAFGKPKQLRLKNQEIDTFTNPDDRELLAQLIKFPHDPEYNSSYRYQYYGNESVDAVNIPPALLDYLLPRLAATGRLVWMLDIGQPFEDARPLTWDDGDPWQFEMKITPEEKKQRWTVEGLFSRSSQTRPMHDAVLTTPTGVLLMDNTLFQLDTQNAYGWLHAINVGSPVEVPYKDRALFLKQLWSAPVLPKIDLPKNLQWKQLHELPQPKIKIYAPEKTSRQQRQKGLVANISFLYGPLEVQMNDPQGSLPSVREPGPTPRSRKSKSKKTVTHTTNGKPEAVYVRNRDAEKSQLADLASFGVTPVDKYYGNIGDVEFPQKLLSALVDQLLAKGWQVEAEGKLYRSAGDFHISVQSEIDWFELDASFDFDGTLVQLPELLAAVRKGEKFVELGDGTRGILPEQWLAKYQTLADLGTVENGKVRFKPSQALLLDAMLQEQENLQVDRKFNQFRKRLREFDGIQAKHEPKTFHGTLRDYQRDGLGWFHFLRLLGLGGCLADDMGLGKTIQVLALLENRRTRRLKKDETRRPSLVVAPKSLIFNWIDEANRFTPKLRVANYTGLDRKERVGNFDDHHLVITTYGTIRRDIAELKDQQFDYTILDESQAIKNSTSLSAKASRLLQASHRLALTGTPIENHLGELWSLFEYLNPGMLGRSGAFASLCKSVKPGKEGSLADLAQALAPFILRRTKDQVLKELPEKTEQTLHCDLLPKQRKQYDELRDFYRAKLTKTIDQRGLKQSKIHVLEALLRLRQAACHPGLVDRKMKALPSAKLNVLLEQIREIVAEGHKTLVFSQFTSLLAIVRQTLDAEKIRYEYLDGRTRNRKEKVDRFQTDPTCPLFLISLKAGGTGLNLTAADYVFILDPWWNPAVEAQAIDRTHRIGQTRPVFAYRIIARDTVEEKVLKLQEGKRNLANAVISADDSLLRNLTAEDLKLILS